MDKTWMNEIDAENLNEKYKEVFILYKKIGMTQKMVGEELGCTPQNISLILNSIKNKEPKAEKQKTRKQKTEKRKSKKRTTVSENYQQYNRRYLFGYKARKIPILSRLHTFSGKKCKKIFQNPAADCTVIRHDNDWNQAGNHAQKSPPGTKFAIGCQWALFRLPSYRNLRHQQRESKRQRQNQVNHQIQPSPVLGSQIGEPPDIPQPYSASCRCKDKTY